MPRGGDPRFGADADDTGCPILHVDMDAFFASVEVQRRPELRGRPVVVGGVGPRGVVNSATYEARAYGVRSAMPTARARALCPHAVFLPPDFARYREVSRAVMQIFRDITPLVEPLSLDEAFLDVSGARRLFGRPAQIARLIRERVADEQGLTCSVGVAPNKFLAKLGSARAKPDGMVVVPVARVLEFLHPLPVSALWGVGERAAEKLTRLGLRTVGDVAAAPLGMLRAALGEAAAAQLHDLAHGRDPRRVDPERPEKSIGAEVTFNVDVVDPLVLRRALLSLADKVGSRLRAAGQAGRTVSIKVRYATFRTVTRSRTLSAPTDVGREIFETAWSLLTSVQPAVARLSDRQATIDPIRLIGVRVDGLVADAVGRQPALGEPEQGWREAEVAVDAATARFGRGAVRPASLLGGHDVRHAGNSPPRRATRFPTR